MGSSKAHPRIGHNARLPIEAAVAQVAPRVATIKAQVAGISLLVNPVLAEFTQVLPDLRVVTAFTIPLQFQPIRAQLALVVQQLEPVGPCLPPIGVHVPRRPADVAWFCRRRRRTNEQPAGNENDSLHDVLLAS